MRGRSDKMVIACGIGARGGSAVLLRHPRTPDLIALGPLEKCAPVLREQPAPV